MIITRAPLRITLGGGGTDLPSFYQKHGGFCVAAAIDKYVYISVHRTFDPGITLKYSEMEHVKTIDEIKHPIIRECLKMVGIRDPHIEIASHADIPAGTGLGSSSSFTVALLAALLIFQGFTLPPPATLAEMACEIEINILKQPIGKQDQFMAAFGGLRHLGFCADGTVEVGEYRQDQRFWPALDGDLLMFYTGKRRSASEAMQQQNGDDMANVMDSGYAVNRAINNVDRIKFADEINRQWNLKLKRTPNFDTDIIKFRAAGLAAGAEAGKLVGAGGGGFLLFYAPYSKNGLRAAMFDQGLPELRFTISLEGIKVIAE